MNNQATAEKREVKGGKFLTFFLDAEEYGIEILRVQEIIGVMPITPVPRTPDFIRGVINLRGKIISIIDIRLKLSMAEAARTEETCIIVVKARGIEMGIIVDKVSEVADIAGAEIQDAPSFGVGINTDYILGIGKSDKKVRLLLDIDKVLSSQDVVELQKTQAGEPPREEM
jgi:purine-binding chemotaxis protein CheW